MSTTARPKGVLCFAAIAIACSHAATGPRADPAVAVEYPPPPEAPRARLIRMVPDASMNVVRPPAWRRLFDLLVGVSTPKPATLLQRPFGVAAVGADEIAIADPDAQRVVRMNLRSSEWREVACADREWGAPMALAAGRDGDLYVADGAAGEIVAVSRTGSCRPFGGGTLVRPTGVAYVAGKLYVVDPPKHTVVVFSESGDRVGGFGSLGSGAGQFNFPTSIAADVDGALLVVDALNFRIARISASGEWLGAFGSPGETGGELARPKGVAVGGGGTIYVADAQRDTVLVYSRAGEYLFSIGAGGDGAGQLAMPAGVAAAGSVLYVADSHHQRVQAFGILGD